MKSPGKQIITCIHRLPGSRNSYRIELACDHWRKVTGVELEREQLVIGKAVVCTECGRKGFLENHPQQ